MILGFLGLVTASLFAGAAFYVNFAEQPARLARDPCWLIGAFVLLAPWPYTLLVIKPVNDKLKAADPLGAGAPTRALIERWGRLHAGRTVLGVLATATFFCAAMAR
jgi:hypothetical protein